MLFAVMIHCGCFQHNYAAVLQKKGEPVRAVPMDMDQWSKGLRLLDQDVLANTLAEYDLIVVPIVLTLVTGA